jgi:hypothetical protein
MSLCGVALRSLHFIDLNTIGHNAMIMELTEIRNIKAVTLELL